MKNTLENIKKPEKYDLIVVDAMNLVKRMEWVFRHLKNSKGVKSGIIYGCLNFVLSKWAEFGKTSMVFVWDSHHNNRKDGNSDYKANRKTEHATDLWEQVRNLKICLSFLGVQQAIAEGYEADDVASKIVKDAKKKKILLVTNDCDWYQMLSPTVHIFKNNKVNKMADVEKEEEIQLDAFTIFKAVVGDKSDNIKGIKGIPKKKVWDMLKGEPTLDGFFGECVKVDDKWAIAIMDGREQIIANFKLVSLVDKGYDINYIQPCFDKERLLTILKTYEMTKLSEKVSNVK